jgi:tetratricopeptide (TPR) repeat protein
MNLSSRSLTSNNKDISLWRDKAESSLKTQSWNECIKACEKLLTLDPKHHFAQETLATALLQLGQVPEAVSAIQRLLQLSPRDPLHRLRFATLLQMEGKHGESLREFERIVAMYPDAPFTPDAQEAIETLDRLQTSQILLLASERNEFRWQLEREPKVALEENGFYLSDNGFEILCQMIPNAHEGTATKGPKVH